MENMNKTSTTKAMGISILTTVLLFILVMFVVQIMVPAYVFDTPDYYILLILLELIPLGIGIWLYLVLSGQRPSDIISFSKPQAKMNRKNMIWLILIGAAMALGGRTFLATLQLGWVSLLEALGFKMLEASFPPIDSGMTFLWATLGVAVTPALLEEMVFRGVVQKGLLRNSKPKIAIIISSLLFMLMHLSVETMMFTFSCGLLLGYMAYKSGSILPSIAFHFVNNFLVVVSLVAFNLLDDSVASTQFEMNEIVILIVFAVISLALLIFAIWGFDKVAKSPPENPYLKPMKPSTVVMLVLAGCILFLVMAALAIVQNVMII